MKRVGDWGLILFAGCLLTITTVGSRRVIAQVMPDHPILTEVYTDPNGPNDGPVGRDLTNLHQEFVELYLPTCADLNPSLSCSSLKMAFDEVEGDHSSSGFTLLNYRWDLPTFCVLANPNNCPVNTVPRPPSGVVVLGWVDYVGDPPFDLAGTPSTRVALVNGGITSTGGNYVFVAINGHHFTGTTNFPILLDESLIDLPNEARSGQIQNGSGAYLLLNRDDPGYVVLYDDKDTAHVPPLSNADPDLPNDANGLASSALFDGYAGNDDSLFDVLLQPLPLTCDPVGNPLGCIDLEPVLPSGGAFSLLIPQIPETVTTGLNPGQANGYARVFVDVPKTTETAAADDPVVDALNAYRHIRNNGPFFPTPGKAPFTTSNPELSVALGPEQIFDVLSQTTREVPLLAANVGGSFPIDMTVTATGASSDPTVATFAPGAGVTGITGQSLGFPMVVITGGATASDLATATSQVTVTASNSGGPAIVNPVQSTTATATVLNPTTGLDANGLPFQTTVFVAILPLVADPGVANEFRASSLGAFLAAQPDITALETQGHGAALIDPLTNLNDPSLVIPWIKGLPKGGQSGQQCTQWLPRPGIPLPGFVQTVTGSAEVLSGTGTYDTSIDVCIDTGQTVIKAIRLNVPDTKTFDGTYSPSEMVSFVEAKGNAGKAGSPLTDVTTSRTFEIALVDTNLNTNGSLENGSTDDFGIVIEVAGIEPGSPFSIGDFVFLSFSGGPEGADIDTLNVPPGGLIGSVILLDLDNLHSQLGISSVEAVFVVDAGPTGSVEMIEAFSLNLSPACNVNADCDDGLFCNGTETCVNGTCQSGLAPCNDGVSCTVDTCLEATDTCTNTPDNTICDDGLFCNGTETCDAALDCQTGTPVNCDDGVACTLDACNETTDSCDQIPNDALCDNGLFCDGAETCDAILGCLSGTPVNCGDAFICTVDTCNEATDSCDHNPNDVLCDNGLFCDGTETCDATLGCLSGTPVNCDDGVFCTVDICDESVDSCVQVPTDVLCDNGLFCDGVERCDPSLGCQPGADPCPNPALVCDEIADACTGCSTNAECDDGLFCNGAETCVSGACQAGASPCDDSVPCTVDSCDEATHSCSNTPNDGFCDNGLFCDGTETCNATSGCQAGTAPNCDDQVACTVDTCNETSNTCQHVADDAACDNGQFCDGAEICDVVLGCQPGTFPCDDGVNCTVDFCSLALQTCFHTPRNELCNDGVFCNGTETCDAIVGCQSGGPPSCDDGVPCTVDACNPLFDICVHSRDDTLCDDGLFCNGAETCDAALGCQPGSDPCTDPSFPICDEPTDSCVAGTVCTVDSDCNDGDVCTRDRCVATACVHTPNSYGDVDQNDTVNIFDLFCILNGFAGDFTNCSFVADDLNPCAGNGTVDIFDLFAVLNAFGGIDPCCGGLP